MVKIFNKQIVQVTRIFHNVDLSLTIQYWSRVVNGGTCQGQNEHCLLLIIICQSYCPSPPCFCINLVVCVSIAHLYNKN